MLNFEQQYPGKHSNKYVLLHGIPYLVGEYVDRTRFDQIDNSMVGDGIIVDQSDPMRPIVDIQLSDIERNNSDGRLRTIGNSSKLANMIDIIKHDWNRTEGRLRVLRKGLLLRIYYQIENARNGIVLRSINETFRIEEPNYFVYINPEDIGDNSLIVNFSDSKITAVSQFTYGRDPMVLRITDIQMCYEVTEMDPMKPRVERRVARDPSTNTPYYGPDADAYYYHQKMQNGYCFENYNWRVDRCQVPPETWTVFNRFYHYDEEEQNFHLHFDEIYSPYCKVIPLACGKIKVNKTFIVNPGSRLVFKFCIWKNDSIITNSSAQIADALRIPNPVRVSNTIGYLQPIDSIPSVNTVPTNYGYEPIPKYSTPVDYAQNKVINQLIDIVANLELKVSELVSQNSSTGGSDGTESTTSTTGGESGTDQGGDSGSTTTSQDPEPSSP